MQAVRSGVAVGTLLAAGRRAVLPITVSRKDASGVYYLTDEVGARPSTSLAQRAGAMVEDVADRN